MANHVLSLEVPDTMNKCVLRIMDTSIYNPQKPPTCQLLQVTPPGWHSPIQFNEGVISPGFSVNLTACDLEMQTVNCGSSYSDLPDGIYIIKYSVAPNDIVYVEYNHLRITCALTKIQSIYCDLDLAACDPPVKKKEKLQKVQFIQQILNAAKAEVEYCHQPKKGMDLYRYAMKLINELTCSSGCSTC